MEIKLLASNVENFNKISASVFAARMAGTCYMDNSMESILGEPEETSLKRAERLLKMGHHSPFEHVTFTFLMEGIPKILAMILNNEKVYCTSEKSARYTRMKVRGPEAAFYKKWLIRFMEEIFVAYPGMSEKNITKLAQENARYGISIFSPATVMVHSTNLRQLSYVLSYMEEFCENCPASDFTARLVPVLKEFITLMEPYRVHLLQEKKNCHLSLFGQRLRASEYGESYSTSYSGSFAMLAQAQRHRTISYEMLLPDMLNWRCYIPPIIRSNPELKAEWIEDMASVVHLYPQGLLVEINERGTLENFVRKCHERLCGAAQLEIAERTRTTLQRYISSTKLTKPFVYRELLPYTNGPRCKFGYKCSAPCFFGPEGAFSRKV